jgi:signal transduction histidine kinase
VRILGGLGRGLLLIPWWIGRALGRFVAWCFRRLTVALRHPQVRFVLTWLVAVSAACVAFGTAGTVYDTDQLGWALMPFIGAIAGLPFVLILTRPLTGLLVSAGAAFVLSQLPLVDRDPWPWLVVHGLVMLSLLFAVCVRESLQRAIGGWLILSSLFYWGVPNDIAAGWVIGVTSVAVVGLLVGRLVSTNRALARQEEVSSAEKARRVLLEERARIARDLHDIVAHHMSLVVVQSETAGYRVPDLSDAARAELLSIGETARSALAETRALLGVLRQDGQAIADAPQPKLTQIVDLVDAGQRAGVRLEAQISGDLGVLRPGASLAAYRIAQEALANAARHAPGAPVRLVVEQLPDGIRLRVENGPVAGADPAVTGTPGPPGHGITGMRERAAAAGGRLELGPTTDGGFAVELFLPTSEEDSLARSGPREAAEPVNPPERYGLKEESSS